MAMRISTRTAMGRPNQYVVLDSGTSLRGLGGYATLVRGKTMSKPQMKSKITGTVKIKIYEVVRRAVEDGVARGWQRAHKHTETPPQETIIENVIEAIMGDICEVLDFE
jgi:hypothetical protein